jgi:hypothetical protein
MCALEVAVITIQVKVETRCLTQTLTVIWAKIIAKKFSWINTFVMDRE